MPNGQLDLVLRHIRKMVDGPDAVQDWTDQELLGRFATHHEEVIFEALMQRHGCKRVRFAVYIKEGRASLKATPVKE